jgi:DNA-binding ferritin-like protein
MTKISKMTKKRRMGGEKTRKNMASSSSSTSSTSSSSSKSSVLRNFQREITVNFFEMLLLIKLFHWKTHSYATHKATDDLYSKFNEHMDKFIEVLLGKSGTRIDLMNKRQISLYDLNNQDELVSKVNSFKGYLVNLTNNKAMKVMTNTDLLNIRDEILGDMNQFLYLLSFK